MLSSPSSIAAAATAETLSLFGMDATSDEVTEHPPHQHLLDNNNNNNQQDIRHLYPNDDCDNIPDPNHDDNFLARRQPFIPIVENKHSGVDPQPFVPIIAVNQHETRINPPESSRDIQLDYGRSQNKEDDNDDLDTILAGVQELLGSQKLRPGLIQAWNNVQLEEDDDDADSSYNYCDALPVTEDDHSSKHAPLSRISEHDEPDETEQTSTTSSQQARCSPKPDSNYSDKHNQDDCECVMPLVVSQIRETPQDDDGDLVRNRYHATPPPTRYHDIIVTPLQPNDTVVPRRWARLAI